MRRTSINEPVAGPHHAARPTQLLLFKMRAEFRRAAVYFGLGMALVVACIGAIWYLVPGKSWGQAVPFALLALASVAVTRWRLRVGESGIARRRHFRWDLWPWEAFEQGNVLDSEGEPAAYVFPQKPFWARKLNLALLEDVDREQVEAIIAGRRLIPAVDLPTELTLKYGFRKEALIAPGGLLLREHGSESRYAWNEAQVLRIRRHGRRRRDFESLEIVFPDRVVSFAFRRKDRQLIRSWSGARGCTTPTGATLAGVLERMIPPDRVQIISMSDAPVTIEEWQDRRSILDKKGREVTFMWRFIWGAAALMLLHSLSSYGRGIIWVIGIMVMYAPALGLAVIVARYIEQDHRNESAELEAQKPGH
jgi:hypothetical protein